MAHTSSSAEYLHKGGATINEIDYFLKFYTALHMKMEGKNTLQSI